MRRSLLSHVCFPKFRACKSRTLGEGRHWTRLYHPANHQSMALATPNSCIRRCSFTQAQWLQSLRGPRSTMLAGCTCSYPASNAHPPSILYECRLRRLIRAKISAQIRPSNTPLSSKCLRILTSELGQGSGNAKLQALHYISSDPQTATLRVLKGYDISRLAMVNCAIRTVNSRKQFLNIPTLSSFGTKEPNALGREIPKSGRAIDLISSIWKSFRCGNSGIFLHSLQA